MDYDIDVIGVVSTYHANMLKQYVERRNDCLIVYCLLKQLSQLTTNTNTLTSEQRKEVETLMKQYPDVLSSLPGRTD